MAAVEFALILPIALILFFGTFETANALFAYMKLIAAAETAADLIAQQPSQTPLHVTDIDDDTIAVQQVMAPLPPGNLGVAYASVNFDQNTGAPSVSWQQVRGANPIANAAALAQGMGSPGDSVIIVAAQYTYTLPMNITVPTPFGPFSLPNQFNLNELAFARPRNLRQIAPPT